MNLGNLLTPWLELVAVLIILIYVEKWIHSHLYGVGWLLTNDQKTATALYYLLLSPGVFVHEFTQYLVAGALNVKIKRVMAWPEAQEDGTLRLNFVQIKQANWLQSAVIGAAPFLVGLGLVWAISNHILNLEDLLAALVTADVTLIGHAIQKLASTSDFYLWLYLMFAISNAMLPTPSDREGWPLLLAIFAAGIVGLVILGTGETLLKTFTGPVAHGVDLLTTAFATVLVVEVFGVILIGFAEEIAERITKRKFFYGKARAETRARERQPGSSDPLPAGTPLPSIYNLPLPVPTPSEVRSPRKPARPAVTAGAAASVRPSLSDTSSLEPQDEPAVRPGFAPLARPPLSSTAGATPSPSGRELSPRFRPLGSENAAEAAPASSFAPGRTSRPALGADSMSRAPSPPAGGLPPRRSPLEAEDGDSVPASPFAPGRSSRPALGTDLVSRAPSSPAGGLPQRRSLLEADDEDDAPARPPSSKQFSRPVSPSDAATRPPLSGSPDRFSRPRPLSPLSLDDDEEQDDDNEVQYIPLDDV